MTVGELETLRREGAECCLVIMDDSGYGNILRSRSSSMALVRSGSSSSRRTMRPWPRRTKSRPFASRTQWTGVCPDAARDHAGPVLVEVPVDPR